VTDSALEAKGLDPVLFPAFRRTLDKVGTDEAFLAALMEPRHKSESVSSGDELVIECEPSAAADASFSFEDEKQSVVTVFEGAAFGSGVFISADGLLLTAAHVVSGNKECLVELSSKVRLPASVIRVDSDADVALLRVTGGGFRPARCSAQPQLQPGKDVLVIGTPLSNAYSLSVSRGVVSGIRKIDGVEYVQTDAAVNRGNSGGPMFDGSGNLIGIVVLKRIDPNAEGVGFGVSLQQATHSLRLRFALRASAPGK
jgi:S1-C subfamily serine protease